MTDAKNDPAKNGGYGRRGRRWFLRSTAVAAVAAVAGCSGSDSTETTTTAGSTATGRQATTDRRTATGRQTPTGTPTRTRTTTTGEATGEETATDGGRASVSDPPTTGDPVEELAPIDEAVREFVVDHDVPAGALAVARDGEVLLQRGYGWADEARTQPTPPDARFRIASVTKGLTMAAIRSLERSGGLSMDTRAFPTLGLDPLPGESQADAIDEITVEHLLNHQGGLGPLRSVSPLLGIDTTFEMATAMDLSEPPSTRQRIRYMLGQPLQFEPGSREAYSNFGYAVLSQLVAELTGTPFPEYLRTEILGGIAEDRLYEGRTLPAQRRASEVDYHGYRRVPNVMALDRNEMVPYPDGGFHLEATGGAGELVATSTALLEYMADYWLIGEPRTDERLEYVLFGSLPGTFTMAYQHPSGADVVVLLNDRGSGRPTAYADVRDVVRSAIGEVESWP